MGYDREKMRRKIKRRLKKSREQFDGKYKDELDELMGLSRKEIDKITPGELDLQKYYELIEVVKVATEENFSKAQLRDHILELGEVAVGIAGRISGLRGVVAAEA